MSQIKFTKIYEIQSTSCSSNFVEEDKILRLKGIKHNSELDGFVVLSDALSGVVNEQIYLHKEIFGKFKKDYEKTVSIIKIKADTGKTIYREYQGKAVSGFNTDTVALSPNSIKLLSRYNNDDTMTRPDSLTLSPGHKFPFYWSHPDKAIKISFRMGLLSIALSVISIITAIIGLF